MPRSYIYRLSHTQTAAAAGAAEITVPGDCRIVGIHAFEIGVGGAGGGYYRSEVAINNNATTNASTNYPPRNLTLASFALAFPNAQVASMDTGFMQCDVPVKSGDRLSINQTMTGTAAASHFVNADVYIVE